MFWTGIVGLFDVVFGHGIYHQLRTTQFVTARGEIISSQVESDHDSDGTTYRPKVTFEYDVNDQTLLGKSVRYGAMGSSGSYAHDFVADHPPGKKVDVHYDPSNPSDAVLVTGIEGYDLFILMFLTPFNVVMIGGWYVMASILKQMLTPESLSRPCRYIDDGYEMRIMKDRVSLIRVAGICLLALCFICVFVVGFGSGDGFHPSMRTMLIVWPIILLISTSVTGWFAMRNWSGRYDIRIHHFDKEITLPATHKREEEVTLPFKEIEKVYVDKNVQTDSEGDKVETFFVRIKIHPDSLAVEYKTVKAETLAKFHDEEDAYRFADWFAADVIKRQNKQVH